MCGNSSSSEFLVQSEDDIENTNPDFFGQSELIAARNDAELSERNPQKTSLWQ